MKVNRCTFHAIDPSILNRFVERVEQRLSAEHFPSGQTKEGQFFTTDQQRETFKTWAEAFLGGNHFLPNHFWSPISDGVSAEDRKTLESVGISYQGFSRGSLDTLLEMMSELHDRCIKGQFQTIGLQTLDQNLSDFLTGIPQLGEFVDPFSTPSLNNPVYDPLNPLGLGAPTYKPSGGLTWGDPNINWKTGLPDYDSDNRALNTILGGHLG